MALRNGSLALGRRRAGRRGHGLVAGVLGVALLSSCTSGNDAAGLSTATSSSPGASVTTSPSSSAAPSSGAAAPGAPATITAEQVQAGLDRVDGFVKDEMAATGVPGMAVGIVHDDTVVFTGGYGVRELGKPDTVDPQTVFQLASLSKPLSSTGVAALVGKGTIAWTDPVSKYDPDLVFSDDYVTRNVTFADLYSHRSGLPAGVGDAL